MAAASSSDDTSSVTSTDYGDCDSSFGEDEHEDTSSSSSNKSLSPRREEQRMVPSLRFNSSCNDLVELGGQLSLLSSTANTSEALTLKHEDPSGAVHSGEPQEESINHSNHSVCLPLKHSTSFESLESSATTARTSTSRTRGVGAPASSCCASGPTATQRPLIKTRVPIELQTVFLKSLRGEEVHEPPKSSAALFFRKWMPKQRKNRGTGWGNNKKQKGGSARKLEFGSDISIEFDKDLPPNNRGEEVPTIKRKKRRPKISRWHSSCSRTDEAPMRTLRSGITPGISSSFTGFETSSSSLLSWHTEATALEGSSSTTMRLSPPKRQLSWKSRSSSMDSTLGLAMPVRRCSWKSESSYHEDGDSTPPDMVTASSTSSSSASAPLQRMAPPMRTLSWTTRGSLGTTVAELPAPPESPGAQRLQLPPSVLASSSPSVSPVPSIVRNLPKLQWRKTIHSSTGPTSSLPAVAMQPMSPPVRKSSWRSTSDSVERQ